MSSVNTKTAVISFFSTLQKDVVNVCGVEPDACILGGGVLSLNAYYTMETPRAFVRYADCFEARDVASTKRADVTNTTVQNPRSTSFVQMSLGEQRYA